MASSTQTEITETMSPKLELKAEKSPQTAPTTHGEAPEQISQPVPPFAANDRIAEDDISQAPETRSFPLTNEKQDIAGQVPLRFYASGHQGTNPPAQIDNSVSADESKITADVQDSYTQQPMQQSKYVPPENKLSQPVQNPGLPMNGPIIPLDKLGERQVLTPCPFCNRVVWSHLEKENGTTVALWSACLCIFVGCLCAFIPCMIDSCKDTVQKCSQCGRQLAVINPNAKVRVDPNAKVAISRHQQRMEQEKQHASGQPAKGPGMGQEPAAGTTEQEQGMTEKPRYG